MSKYKNNYLKHVIIKVDFDNMLPIDDNLPKDILEAAQKPFPLFEPMPIADSEINFLADGAKVTNVEQGINWIFYGANREKALSIVTERVATERRHLSPSIIQNTNHSIYPRMNLSQYSINL